MSASGDVVASCVCSVLAASAVVSPNILHSDNWNNALFTNSASDKLRGIPSIHLSIFFLILGVNVDWFSLWAVVT